jgi:hypothetical protein
MPELPEVEAKVLICVGLVLRKRNICKTPPLCCRTRDMPDLPEVEAKVLICVGLVLKGARSVKLEICPNYQK